MNHDQPKKSQNQMLYKILTISKSKARNKPKLLQLIWFYNQMQGKKSSILRL